MGTVFFNSCSLKWELILKELCQRFFKLKLIQYTFKYGTLISLLLPSLMTLQNNELIVCNNWWALYKKVSNTTYFKSLKCFKL